MSRGISSNQRSILLATRGRTFVYFLYNEQTHLIKIGKSCRPIRRMQGLSSKHGGSCIPLAIIDAPDDVPFHRMFQALRQRGEWFAPKTELLNYIATQRRISYSENEDLHLEYPARVLFSRRAHQCV